MVFTDALGRGCGVNWEGLPYSISVAWWEGLICCEGV